MAKKNRKATKPKKTISVEHISHPADSRKNIPTAETQGFMVEDETAPARLKYERNTDLDPQLMWRGKDREDEDGLTVETVPIYIQEKIQPRAVIDDLKRQTAARREEDTDAPDLFADFNGLPDIEAKLEFYQHDQNWSNRMILGDALLVMNSLAEKENLRGKVQCIYLDPPYGIRFNSNWQFSTKTRDVQDGKAESVAREPEVIKAFRDTWADGVNTYLSYLRDRLIVARDLLTESGSIFVQIGDENVHYVRAVMDEVFGRENFVSLISVSKTSGSTETFLANTIDYLVWYAKSRETVKYRALFHDKIAGGQGGDAYQFVEFPSGERYRTTQASRLGRDLSDGRAFRLSDMTSQSVGRSKGEGAASWFDVQIEGRAVRPSLKARWKTNEVGMERLAHASRLSAGRNTLNYVRYIDDFPAYQITNAWMDVGSSVGGDKLYVVQTSPKIVERCILMTTDPGDLVLDPTCGSGTTAYVAEQWGRRWITIDTSRVALTLARQRLMTARFPYYFLKDRCAGDVKEGEVTGRTPAQGPFDDDIHQGFVYERVPHITLKSIANNAEIDVIYDRWQRTLEPLRAKLNELLGESWEDWQIPREAADKWPAPAKKTHAEWWDGRIARQREIDDSIARNADQEFLYDRPYQRPNTVRVTGPFTVESLSPHRVLPSDRDDEALLDALDEMDAEEGRVPRPRSRLGKDVGDHAVETSNDFAKVVLENLKAAGIQNTKRDERLEFSMLKPWAGGKLIHAEGRYMEGETERRAAIHIGPEFGTVGRATIVGAAREANENGFDTLAVCGFAFDAMSAGETFNMGRLTVLTARMNQDLHMSDRLRKTGAGNLFVVFGEPDVRLSEAGDGLYQVEIRGVDIFDPTTGEVKSSKDPQEDIACWFIDTNYDQESFFIRHAYFLGGSGKDAYDRLRRALKSEIDENAWASLHATVSRPFPRPTTGRIAVKVINHLGDEVMQVYEV